MKIKIRNTETGRTKTFDSRELEELGFDVDELKRLVRRNEKCVIVEPRKVGGSSVIKRAIKRLWNKAKKER